jgi:hypothetical protein
MADIDDVAATRERLNKTIHDMKGELSALKGADERATKAEQLAAQLKTDLDAVKRAQADAANRPLTPDDVSVERAYCRPVGKNVRVADLGKGQAVTPKNGVTHLGSNGGVVKLVGSVERGRWSYGLLDDPAPKDDWQREAQERAEEIGWLKAFNGQASRERWDDFRDHMRQGPPAVAKVFADNAGEGGEFIVSIPMAQMERTAELMRTLEAQIPGMQLSNVTQTMPFLSTGAQPFLHGVPASGDLTPGTLPKSVPTTAERTVTAKTLTVNIPIDRDSAEDSIIAAIPLLQMLVGEALRDGTEDALINSDTTATHGDTGLASWSPRSRWPIVGSSLDHRKAWIGFRHRAIDTSAHHDYGSTQSVADYMGALSRLTVPHAFGSVVYITSPEHYLVELLTDSNLLTVDKYGPAATILTGEVGRIGGHPLILSEFMDKELNASGIFDNSTKTKTGMCIVNLARFVMARLRSMRVEVETVVREHTHYVVASERKTLHTFDGSSTKNAAYLYNLSV